MLEREGNWLPGRMKEAKKQVESWPKSKQEAMKSAVRVKKEPHENTTRCNVL